MRVCLYFGSFNPFHIGHHALATYMMKTYKFDKLLFVLSPLNPQKKSSTMMPFVFRRNFLEACISEDEAMEVCTLETRLPEPHYTIRSLNALRLLMPSAEFSLLIGADNLVKLNTWYNYQGLADFCELYVYPREGYDLSKGLDFDFEGKVHICENVPMIDVSSTEIREAIRTGQDLRCLIPKPELWTDLLSAHD